uniref:HMG box domain-containing protein n=1 Tax=Romanomermis culicivorax TaxID=13658 RepID=A0A915L3I1_ROMCU
MPGQKTSYNAFFVFMQEYRSREEKKALGDVVQPAGEEWQSMSAEEKYVYKLKAINYKNSSKCRQYQRCFQPTKLGKKTPVVVPSLSLVTKKSVETTKMKMLHFDNSSKSNAHFTEDSPFFIDVHDDYRAKLRRRDLKSFAKNKLIWNLEGNSEIMENYYGCLEERKFIPAEIAIVEFTIADGVTKTIHSILKPRMSRAPAQVPWYLALADATRFGTASTTHRINPNSPPSVARKDYRRLADEIKTLDNNLQHYFFYVLSSEFNDVVGAVEAIRNKIFTDKFKTSRRFIPPNKIICVEDLYEILMEFKNQSSDNHHDQIRFKSLTIGGCGWDTERSLRCSFHNLINSRFCALAKARKAW